MNEQLKKIISTLIDRAIHPEIPEAPHDYVSLRENILLMELRQEIDALNAMLCDPATFEEQFKQRCAWRLMNTEQSISIVEMPESQTNQLYWQIASQVFAPKTMSNMLKIILPHTRILVTASLALSREDKPRVEPVLQQSGDLDSLTDPPTIEALTH